MIWFLIFLVPSLLLLSPTVHWLDSTELALAAGTLGVGHPPGQVTHAILGFLFSFFPFGDLSFRISLFSALCLAGAFTFVWYASSEEKRNGVLLLFFLFILLNPKLIWQGTRPEVYGLSALLFGFCFWIDAQKKDDRRWIWISWLLWTWGMWNHPIIGLSILPFLSFSQFSSSIWVIVLGSSVAIFLPLRAFIHPAWNFGLDPNFNGVVWFLEGKLYKAFNPILFQDFYNQFLDLVIAIVSHIRFMGFALLLFACYSFIQKKSSQLIRYLLCILINMIPVARMTNFSTENPDVYGYLLPTFLVLCFMGFEGFEWFNLKVKNQKWGVGLYALVFALLSIKQLLKNNRTPDFGALQMMETVLREPLPESNVHAASFQTFSMMRYGQVIEGLRPDLNVFYRGLVRGEHTKKEIQTGDYWELAIDRRDEKYTLRIDDLNLKPKLRQTGWFYRVGVKGVPIPMKAYSEIIESILKETPDQNELFLEPMILNPLNHWIFYNLPSEDLRKMEFARMIQATFPWFKDFNELNKKL